MRRTVLITALAGALVSALPRTLFPSGDLWLAASTFLGGAGGADVGWGIDLDDEKNIYVVGYTYSSDFPVVGAYQSTRDWDADAFVSKFSSSGTGLVFSTFLGGASSDYGYAIAVDPPHGQLLVTGRTLSCNFPVLNGFQSTCGGNGDAFVAALPTSGSSLIVSSYLGGEADDKGRGIGIDQYGYVYVAGETSSDDFPTLSCYQGSRQGGVDGFLAELFPAGSSLYYSTYLGGSADDYPSGLAVRPAGFAFVAGTTKSGDFPEVNAYQGNNAGESAFVSKFAASGSYLHYSTYLGGSGDDGAGGIFVDSYDAAYVAGFTLSPDFPTFNAYQASHAGGYDAFVTCLGSPGFTLIYSSYFGGSGNDYGLAVEAEGDYSEAFLCGATMSYDFPALLPYQATFSGGAPYGDAFFAHLAPDGDILRPHSSTYLGGTADDLPHDLALDYAGQRAWLVGETNSQDFPVRWPFQPTHGGGITDAFVTGLDWGSASARNQYHTDFDGDGVSDIAIFRAAEGLWSVRSVTRAYLGNSLDAPVPADYDGDGVAEIATYRPSAGMWAVLGLTRVYFGSAWDQARPADYNGDGRADFGLFRPDGGVWAVRDVTRAYFGTYGDAACPGYYDSDDRADMAIFRAGSGLWSIRNLTRFNFGAASDTAVPGDYGLDASWEAAVFNLSSGLWAIRGLSRFYLGSSGDRAVPGDYNGDGWDISGVFRDAAGLWSVRAFTRVYFGGSGDIPVTR